MYMAHIFHEHSQIHLKLPGEICRYLSGLVLHNHRHKKNYTKRWILVLFQNIVLLSSLFGMLSFCCGCGKRVSVL